MKINHYLFVLPLCAVFLFNGKTYNDAVAERIGLKVDICLEGQDCGSAAAASSMTSNDIPVKKS
jgi:hypothetical protein